VTQASNQPLVVQDDKFSIQCASCSARVRVGLDMFGRISKHEQVSCSCGRVHAENGTVNFSNGIKVVGKSK
jgi:hypothetical protein